MEHGLGQPGVGSLVGEEEGYKSRSHAGGCGRWHRGRVGRGHLSRRLSQRLSVTSYWSGLPSAHSWWWRRHGDPQAKHGTGSQLCVALSSALLGLLWGDRGSQTVCGAWLVKARLHHEFESRVFQTRKYLYHDAAPQALQAAAAAAAAAALPSSSCSMVSRRSFRQSRHGTAAASRNKHTAPRPAALLSARSIHNIAGPAPRCCCRAADRPQQPHSRPRVVHASSGGCHGHRWLQWQQCCHASRARAAGCTGSYHHRAAAAARLAGPWAPLSGSCWRKQRGRTCITAARGCIACTWACASGVCSWCMRRPRSPDAAV